ncbi:unnamed protein product [[Actinomadura] parvosata subsp. kistnae]|uniref:Uncharacterized protein n=1 Tax=[Actinomadura] parvosata subsp. kistnae TaxID=1909395 RepID=A0A1U9ZVE9_9ACTN|nr:hypothetical protein [Nonomuraea sp. ATCC 55076]AQZ61899.1 hypothetical protein BKM31_10830 [Nonomuraea sp. ATCC 55076]SPL88056.1 unnamed protein product [Actinomadura parvosata subsp. kistnae]
MSSPARPARPALDAELNALLSGLPLVPEITPPILATLRRMPLTPVEPLLEGRTAGRREVTVAPARATRTRWLARTLGPKERSTVEDRVQERA